MISDARFHVVKQAKIADTTEERERRVTIAVS
jgi:hypothetical protein